MIGECNTNSTLNTDCQIPRGQICWVMLSISSSCHRELVFFLLIETVWPILPIRYQFTDIFIPLFVSSTKALTNYWILVHTCPYMTWIRIDLVWLCLWSDLQCILGAVLTHKTTCGALQLNLLFYNCFELTFSQLKMGCRQNNRDIIGL